MVKKNELRPEVSFHNIETGEIIIRQMNDEEYSSYIEELKKHEEKLANLAEEEKRKELAIAKFMALGFTEEDIKAVIK
jgi:hypothetical protein